MCEKIIPDPGAPEFSGGASQGDPKPYVPLIDELPKPPENEETPLVKSNEDE